MAAAQNKLKTDFGWKLWLLPFSYIGKTLSQTILTCLGKFLKPFSQEKIKQENCAGVISR
jgi:hypothetical protein